MISEDQVCVADKTTLEVLACNVEVNGTHVKHLTYYSNNMVVGWSNSKDFTSLVFYSLKESESQDEKILENHTLNSEVSSPF